MMERHQLNQEILICSGSFVAAVCERFGKGLDKALYPG